MRFLATRNASGAPVFAIILQALVAIFLTLTATFNAVLTYVGFTLALFASLTVAGVFVLRRRHPHLKRPFKTWGYPVTPAIFLLLYGWMICYLIIERPLPSAVRPADRGLRTPVVQAAGDHEAPQLSGKIG